MIEVIFSHGKEGSPHGYKSKIIKNICEANNVKFTTIDYKDCNSVNERILLLDSKVKSNTNKTILVGSSMGGYVSAVCSNQYQTLGLFLIWPALYLTGYDVQEFKTLAANIPVRHSWDDSIRSTDNSIKFCTSHKCTLTIDGDDHTMGKTRHELEVHFTNFLKTCNAS